MDALFNWMFNRIGEPIRWLFQTKARPVASFTERNYGLGKLPGIRIKNSSSEYDIEIKGVYAKPEVYFLTEDIEPRTLIDGGSAERPTFILKPQQEKELYIVPFYKDGIRRDSEDQNVTFRISWRKCNVTWLRQIPVYVRVTTSATRKYR